MYLSRFLIRKFIGILSQYYCIFCIYFRFPVIFSEKKTLIQSVIDFMTRQVQWSVTGAKKMYNLLNLVPKPESRGRYIFFLISISRYPLYVCSLQKWFYNILVIPFKFFSLNLNLVLTIWMIIKQKLKPLFYFKHRSMFNFLNFHLICLLFRFYLLC